jgi:hypothetical protein
MAQSAAKPGFVGRIHHRAVVNTIRKLISGDLLGSVTVFICANPVAQAAIPEAECDFIATASAAPG